jgi:hypothetical protein
MANDPGVATSATTRIHARKFLIHPAIITHQVNADLYCKHYNNTLNILLFKPIQNFNPLTFQQKQADQFCNRS